VTDRTGRDWVDWHAEYDDGESRLSKRLVVVQRRLTETLDRAPAGPIQVLSLCAGQGRDVIGVLRSHPRRLDVHATLVELDNSNAEYAEHSAAEAGLARQVHAIRGDAGHASTVSDAVPADVLLLCGIFGNISDADVERTICEASRLCGAGATVIWTRHRAAPDLTPQIRQWFHDAGFEEVAFDGPPGETFGVGTARLTREPAPFDPAVQLFTFTKSVHL
jgi:ubiquinone/menaquinone biosynthesis C-methylase UbiE